jgi:hypothetical protein
MAGLLAAVSAGAEGRVQSSTIAQLLVVVTFATGN